MSSNSVRYEELFIFNRSHNFSIILKKNNLIKMIFKFLKHFLKFVPFLNPTLSFISQEIYRLNINLRPTFRLSKLLKKKSLSRYYYEDVQKIYHKVFKNKDFKTPNEKFIKRIS